MKSPWNMLATGAALVCLAALAPGATAQRADGSAPGNGMSGPGTITADGRFVVFSSSASNLVPHDTNRKVDVFVYTRSTRALERVSVGSRGRQADGHSYMQWISANGRVVAFVSYATNLVAGDTNGTRDVFVRDRATAKTERVSLGLHGAQAKGESFPGGLSATGRYVVFHSEAANLVRGDTNRLSDVFVRDRVTHTTERVSVSSAGRQANGASSYGRISADGRFVAFTSDASNLVSGARHGIFLRDRKTHRTTLLVANTSAADSGTIVDLISMSADARVVAYDAAVWTPTGPGTGEISVQMVAILDRLTGRTETIQRGGLPDWNGHGMLSADGRYLTYLAIPTGARDGVAVYVRDRTTSVDETESVSTQGRDAAGDCESGGITQNGRFVVFSCNIPTLVAGDTNGTHDMFLRDRVAKTTTLVSAAPRSALP